MIVREYLTTATFHFPHGGPRYSPPSAARTCGWATATQLQVNVNNLLDKKYYQQIGFYDQGAWGAPRSVMATVSCQM